MAIELELPPIRVEEVATFYSMFHHKPTGKIHLQVCTTTPCWLRGSGDLMEVCKNKLGISNHETSADGMFSVEEVECLGACANAPMIQIANKEYYEDLTPESFEKLLDELAAGKDVRPGSQTGRQCSAPAGGLTVLTKTKG